MRYPPRNLLVGLILVGFHAANADAAPDQSMSIAPAAVSGATILAADENDRNNDISTPYNAHTHADISSTSANTFNVGDGLAGNKTICANAADSTDMCLRWNDTANLWTVDNPAGTFNQIVTITGTAGLTAGQVLIADGSSSIRATSGGSSGQFLTHQGGGVIPIWTTGASIVVADRVHRTAGDVTTTSSSLVDFTGASITLTTGANPALVGFAGPCRTDGAGGVVFFGVQIDNTTDVMGTTGIEMNTAIAAEHMNCSFTVMTADLTAASHTFDLQWAQSGTVTALVSCGAQNPCQFWVVEVTD